MKRLFALGLTALLGFGSGAAQAAEGVAIPSHSWSFSGLFGTFDRAQLQRGFQVYREVCASCHSIKYIAFRNLLDLGYTPDEVKALAAEYTVMDGPNDDGEMFERAAIPADRYPLPFPNEQAARAANNGAYPPDLSLMTKARKGGADYSYALLIGYPEEPPAGVELMDGMYYNAYFPGHQIAMPAPLYEDLIEYADGTPATVEQMAEDVTAFLMWTAEPNLETRKSMGVTVILFLLVLTGILYAAKKKIWSDLH
ncbi:MAG: cytochrome c1 [Kiloniellales bacterium]|nr:cytochrome c1 [Kiloniellales bacterium]